MRIAGALVGAMLAGTAAQASPFLADSPWPMAHRDPGQRASTPVAGPLGDGLAVDLHRTRAEAGTKFGTSPWHVLSGRTYAGRPRVRTLWGASLSHAYKYVLEGGRLVFADSLALTRVGSISWNLIALASPEGARVVVPQPRGLRRGDGPCRGSEPSLIVLEDGPSPEAPIRCTHKIELSDTVLRRACPIPDGWRPGYSATRTGVTASGEVVTNAAYVRRGSWGEETRDYLVLLDQGLTRIVACAETGPGRSTNNVPSEPLPGGGSAFYVATETELIRLDWRPRLGRLEVAWRVPVAFRGRTGTTPTLVDAGPDRFVVMVDAICAVTGVFTGRIACAGPETGPSRLVAVRRDGSEVLTLDLPPLIRTVENSPAAAGETVVIANYGGYRPAPEVKGVVAARWDPALGRWRVAWVNDQVQMNGVPTISTGSNAVYSSGVAGGRIVMRGLALSGPAAGQLIMEAVVGAPDDWLDAGVNTVVTDAGGLIYGADEGLVHVRPR